MRDAGCAFHARARGEPLVATASTVSWWLLIEQPGPWGADALLESGIPHGVAEELAARARAAAFRPVLLRRTGRRAGEHREAFLVATRPGDRRVERVRFDDPAELTSLDLEGFRRSAGNVGDAVTDPLLLVCTNGRHDRCCAVEGRPVAAAAAAALGDAAWECSHIGGDRFAANLVWLPAGVYYGRVAAAEVGPLATRFAEGRLSLPHYRGRAPYPFPVQAAETLLRERLGSDGLDDLTVVADDRPDADRRAVELADTAGRRWRVVVRVGRQREEHLLTCRATAPARAPAYVLEELTRLAP